MSRNVRYDITCPVCGEEVCVELWNVIPGYGGTEGDTGGHEDECAVDGDKLIELAIEESIGQSGEDIWERADRAHHYNL